VELIKVLVSVKVTDIGADPVLDAGMTVKSTVTVGKDAEM
jgi:hypothetical protein